MFRTITFTLLITVFVLSFSSIAFANYIQASCDGQVQNGTVFNVSGFVKTDTGTPLININVTANITSVSGDSNTTTTGANGNFTIFLTAPATGDYTITVSTPNASTASKSLPTHVRNYSSATTTFIGAKPPFPNGTSFIINVTYSGVPTQVPDLEIFNISGPEDTTWTITNLTPAYNSSTVVQYNITIPASASGKEVLLIDDGAGSDLIFIKPPLVAAIETQDTSNGTTFTFAPSETVRLVAKVYDNSGPVITASVIAFITLPNGTVVNTTLSHSSTTNGTYIATFTTTSQTGFYNLRVKTASGSATLDNTAVFTVQSLDAKLDNVKDFFFEFGSSSAFQAGGQVAFDFTVVDLATDTDVQGAAGGGAGSVNCTLGGAGGFNLISMKNALTGQSLVVTNSNISISVAAAFGGQNVCRINLTAPGNGVYAMTVNATVGPVGNATVNATGFFSVQSYALLVRPISSIGSGQEFLHALKPGTNVTFELILRNLSAGGATVSGNGFAGMVANKIVPLNFVGGSEPDITITNYTVTVGTATDNPRVTVLVPENKTGPFNLEAQVTVGGSTIKGTAFYFAKYINGFAFPGNFFGGHGGGTVASGSVFKCSGTQTFQAKLFDVETNQPAKNVVFNSIKEAREEFTGRSVLSLLTINSSTTSDSSGNANISITFNPSGSYSGFHFFILNVSTSEGKFDVVPGGFECRNLIYFPSVMGIGNGSVTGGGFSVSPSTDINVSVSNIQNANSTGTSYTVTTGTLQILSLDNFHHARGGKHYSGPATTFPLSNGSVSVALSPSNFSSLGSKWPNGFNGMRVRVCDNSTTPATCDVSFGGFQVVAFDVFQQSGFGGFGGPGGPSGPSTLFPSAIFSVNLSVRSNVTAPLGTNTSGVGNTTTQLGFNVSVGLPWEGSVTIVREANGTLTSDSWNKPGDFGSENWEIKFVVPSTVRKGFNMITITVKNYLNETTEFELFATAAKNSVSVPDSEGVQFQNFGVTYNAGNLSIYGFNLGFLNTTIHGNLTSKSGVVCTRANLSVTRFGFTQQIIQYNNDPIVNVSVMLIDNGTAGVYDFVVINKTDTISANKNYTVAAVTQQLSPAFGGMYVRKISSCGFFELINITAPTSGFGSGFGGQHSTNTLFYVPISVKQQGVAQANFNVNMKQIVLQEDFGGGFGGFGFNGFLAASSYNVTSATTDSNGLAFVRMQNFTTAGTYGLIWNISGGGSVDTADFSEVIPIEVKAFNAFGAVSSLTPNVVTLTRNTTANWSAAGLSGYYVYNATWDENTAGQLTSDGVTSTFYIILRNVTFNAPTNALTNVPGGGYTDVLIDDDTNLSQVQPLGLDGTFAAASGNWTTTLSLGTASLEVNGNRTVDENTTRLLFATSQTNFYTFIPNTGTSTSVNVNVTVRVCAQTFDRPAAPIIRAAINLTVEKFSFTGPPTTVPLTMYDPFTNTAAPFVYTGPSGCATFNVSRTNAGETGWTTGFMNTIKGTVNNSGSVETLYVGSISVSCPTSGSCV